MTNAMKFRLTILALVALCAVPAVADVTAKAVLSPPSVPIFRTAQYIVEIEGPKGLAVPVLGLAEALKGINVSNSTPETTEIDAERERVRMVFTLDAMEPGEYAIPAATLDLGNSQKAELPALTFSVREATPEEVAQAGQFVDIGDPALVAPAPDRTALYAGIALAALAALALGLWYWQKGRKPEVWTPPALKPWQVAQNRLNELSARRLPHQGRFEPYYVDLSTILRYYIEDRFHLHAPERTTPEFLDEASRAGLLNDAQQNILAQFLRHCDRVKFARYEPSFEEMEKSFEVVRQFVLETTPSPSAQDAAKEAA